MTRPLLAAAALLLLAGFAPDDDLTRARAMLAKTPVIVVWRSRMRLFTAVVKAGVHLN